MSKPWWQRAKARIRRLVVWKYRDPAPKEMKVRRLIAKKGRTYTRPTFSAEED